MRRNASEGIEVPVCFLSLSGGHYRNLSLSLHVSVPKVICETNIQVDVVNNTSL